MHGNVALNLQRSTDYSTSPETRAKGTSQEPQLPVYRIVKEERADLITQNKGHTHASMHLRMEGIGPTHFRVEQLQNHPM